MSRGEEEKIAGQEVDPDYVPSKDELDDRQNALVWLRKNGLYSGIEDAFNDASPTQLRNWYVHTFVMDPSNMETLKSNGVPTVLLDKLKSKQWYTIEHAAIGKRLIFEVQPDLIAPDPELIELRTWTNEDSVADTMLRLFQPWKSIRYDPEGENWYSVIEPGQWKRHGKGKPSDQKVESYIRDWLKDMSITRNPQMYDRWPYDPSVWQQCGLDAHIAKITISANAFQKFSDSSSTCSRVRSVLEKMSIMHIDTETINNITTVSTFSNGALCLKFDKFHTTDGERKINVPGQLLPMDIEYMVMSANTLPWNDINGEIPHAWGDTVDHGSWSKLEEYEDDLFVQSPTYWAFLTHAFPDPEERSAFLRLLGAAMFGTNLKVVAAMIGAPNAGKDTVINWLGYLMPSQVATLPFSAFTAQGDEDRGFAPLRGARIATVSGEIGEGKGSKLLAEKIKTVSSGGGKIRVAEKYEKPSDVYFDGMLWLQGNSVPTIAGGDTALYTNRLVAVEFKHPFPLVAKSYESLYRREAPAFAQILFINYLRYESKGGGMAGINPPETWRNFTKEFANESNPHGFLENAITDSTVPIPTTVFHAALSGMVAKFGSPYPVGPNFWPKRLRTLGFDTKGPKSVRKLVQRNGQPTWCYFLNVEASLSDGMFSQRHWESALRDASVAS